MRLHVLVIGSKASPNLIGSYARALEHLGHRVSDFDLEGAIRANFRFGKAGELLFRITRHEPWIVQANRQLVVRARHLDCNLVLVPGVAPVRAGTLAQLKASVPSCKLVLLWPDPLQRLSAHVIQALPLYDCVASYSKAALPAFKQLGATRVDWIPFAVDTFLFDHTTETPQADRALFDSEVCFIGNWRPEREVAIAALLRAGIDVKVWGGPSWRTDVVDKALARRYFQGRTLVGPEFVSAMRCARLGLNVIDDTNFPAANMRFFEGPGCGAAMLSSPCPELDGVFRHDESIVYFRDSDELVQVTRSLLQDAPRRMSIARSGERLALQENTYVHRAEQLVRAALDQASGQNSDAAAQ